ncbi:phosphatidate cytidylyltransferase [Microbacterium fluvii]|uniref:Phosphatidate cytidylyltransferase n=1 Tax=Microbacterium fluvii TaxID=415215 RepID=A0ABW2HCD4_9MICO|nr:phosphatidate cytidylyltransferase [Microbacterium fluvii]MCU4672552.1 phosphatidate cytidylyltransferase [Microbacterium fluvii]
MTDAGGSRDEAAESDPPLRRRGVDRHSVAPSGDSAEAPSHRRAAREEFESQVAHARAEFESQVAHARAEFEEVNDRINKRTGRDLLKAIAIGAAIGLVLLASLLFFKQAFILFALAAAVLGIFELSRALTASGRRIDIVPQLVAGVALTLSGYFADVGLHWVVVFVAVALVIVWRLVAQMIAADGRTYGAVLDDVLAGSLLQLYVPFLASLCLVLLRQDHGEWWVLGFIIVAVVSDTGAYASGLAFGRHPMAPRISPNKTWEGFAGAAAAALAAGVLLALFMLGLPWWAGLVFGAAVLLTATAGDLGESMIKRDLGIKDMSSWLPGHGGVLDRLDSILPSTISALALYYLLSPMATI